MEEEMSGATAELAATPITDAPKVSRRGRGRPRKPQKVPADPPAPKRPRGRPKGSKNKAACTTPKEPSKKKRPRGRPRKWPQKSVQPEPESEEEGDQPHLPPPQETRI